MNWKEYMYSTLGILTGMIIGFIYIKLMNIVLSMIFYNVTYLESTTVMFLIMTYIYISDNNERNV